VHLPEWAVAQPSRQEEAELLVAVERPSEAERLPAVQAEAVP
jgi:hypothetical protein